jgi:hypothetical protein
MKKILLTLLTASLALVTTTSLISTINVKALTEILISENFSSGILGTNFIGTNVDVVGQNTQFSDYPNAVDLNGSDNGNITSKEFAFVAGDVITISFGLGGNFASACDSNFGQLDETENPKPFVFDDSDRTAIITFAGVTKKVTSSNPGTVRLESFEIPITESDTSTLIFASTKSTGDPRCGALITDIILTKNSPDPNGGSITIGGSNSQSSSSVSSQLSSSSVISASPQLRDVGVLGFTTTAQEQSTTSKTTIDPNKTTILVSSELRSLIDTAKGQTTRTGGSDN